MEKETPVVQQNGTPANNRTLKVYLKNTIGKGTYGRVKYCVADLDHEPLGLAVKIIKKNSYKDRGKSSSAVEREISILKKIKHPNLVFLIQIVNYRHKVFMFMEFCVNGDIHRAIEMNGPYSESDARPLFSQIVAAVEYLHELDVAHRDLKPENVLLNHQNQVKVTDFGLANFCRDPDTNRRRMLYTRCGTRNYMPPEVLGTNDGYNAMFFDIWSMEHTHTSEDCVDVLCVTGGVLHYMLTSQVPFDGEPNSSIVRQQVSGDIVLLRPGCKRNVSGPAKRLVRHMLEPDVLKRARIVTIKRSKWINIKAKTIKDDIIV